MTVSQYAIGARLERLARASLQRNGYHVIRSAGSKGAVDLAAFNTEHILLIQVKADRITPADRSKLAAFPAPPNALRQFWVRTAEGWNIIDVPPADRSAASTADATPRPSKMKEGDTPDEP
jgi:Holliday junction resolvase-like predicted endonuclease